ncbi:hypothetical protein MKX01_013338 [Papaver californicum]|nr:hypothetical protein MKX01_013338 [Papaver californicum]
MLHFTVTVDLGSGIASDVAASALVGATNVFGTAIASSLMDKQGRQSLLIPSLSGMAVFMLLLFCLSPGRFWHHILVALLEEPSKTIIIMGELSKRGWQQYLLPLQLHPLRTKAITAGVLAGISDFVAQKLSGIQNLQLKCLLPKVLFGLAYGGLFGHFLNKLMEKIFKGNDTKTIAKKVLFEHLTSWMFWPIVGWVNHQYPSLQFRVIFHSFVACCWGIFLNLRAKTKAISK